jgi:L-alanine-DL-glutamate epimerase-like enolase superfamily enzyme
MRASPATDDRRNGNYDSGSGVGRRATRIQNVCPPGPVPLANPELSEMMGVAYLQSFGKFLPFVEKQACDIQPDPQRCGGLLESKRIADLADLYYITCACHNMCTPVGTHGIAHVCAAIRSFVSLESDTFTLLGGKTSSRMTVESFYENGYLAVPDKPGIGVELNDEVCKQHLVSGSRWFVS